MPIFSYQTNDGRTLYGARVNYKDGRRVVQGFTSPEEAWENHWRIRREMMMGVGDLAPQEITLSELAEKWTDFKRSRVKAGRIKESTLDEYRREVEGRILPAFGKRSLDSLSTMELQSWLDRLPSPRLANKCRFLLGNMFKLAIRWRLVEYDPTYALEGYREKRKEGRALSPGEFRKLLLHLDESRRVQVTLALVTGMRIGEINALTWADVQPEYINVDKAFRQGRLETPKTYKGKRLVTISPSVSALLEARRKKAGLVFPGADGKHQEAHVLWYHLQEAARKAGIGKVTTHDLRHTYTTWMVRGGLDPRFLQDQLGHADISTTLGIYTHTTEEARADYRSWFEREIAPEVFGPGSGDVVPMEGYRGKKRQSGVSPGGPEK